MESKEKIFLMENGKSYYNLIQKKPKLLSEQLHKKPVIKYQEYNYNENYVYNESEK
jgi:hypothetical protein